MGTGTLTLDVGGMFAEKSTALQRHGKRFMLAGKKVVFLKPAVDDRYSEDEIVTHDGQRVKAINVDITDDARFYVFEHELNKIKSADVICIDEVQFFPDSFIKYIDGWIHKGKKVYCAGLDLDRFGEPFGIVPYLMARAEEVNKHHAVCAFCGSDAWVTIGTDEIKNSDTVNVGNAYKPACRACAAKHGGIK